MKLKLATAALLLAGTAQAADQVWTNQGDRANTWHTSVYTSASTVKALPIRADGNDVKVVVSASSPVAVTVAKLSPNGTEYQTISLGSASSTPVSITLADPHDFARIKISPTTTAVSETIHMTVIQGAK